jgi:hypothetical protein
MQLSSDPAALQERIISHITEEVGSLARAFPGLIEEWDVCNEPIENHDLQQVLGGDWSVAAWVNATTAADPGVGTRVNEDGPCGASFGRNHTYFYEHCAPNVAQSDTVHRLVPSCVYSV